MVAALKFGKDANGFNAYAPKPSTSKKSIELLNGVAQEFQLPDDEDATFYTVSFRYQPGTSVWVDTTGATASQPAGNTWADTTSELNPASLLLPAGANISMVTGNDMAQVGAVIWQGGSS